MFERVNSLGLFGLNTFPVQVEVDVDKGTPRFEIVGLADIVVKESRDRIRSAFKACGLKFPLGKVLINLAPADTKKVGSIYDLPIIITILKATNIIEPDVSDCAFIGEIALNGDVRGIMGVLPMVLQAKEMGLTSIFVPYDNAFEASVVEGIDVYGVKNIFDIITHFRGIKLTKQGKYIPNEDDYFDYLDYADVKGQQNAKKAIEISAAGGHNILLIGTPGSGKSMLVKRIPTILPKMTFEESIDTTKIHSISGMLEGDKPLVTKRPFRSPHHTISPAGLSGGGSVPKPGEISIANNGVLFLDELAEFSRPTLEILRQPLEDQKVTISRAAGTATYPCSFVLVGAMNPCPCGYFGHTTRNCICSQTKVTQYLSKISGPMLDRFDIQCEVFPVEYENISSTRKEESSASIRERVQKVREVQQERYKGTNVTCNARITSDILQEVCPLTDSANEFLKSVFEKMGLSARAYDKILKVSRTVADMEFAQVIDKKHVAQAVQYRSLDRKYWK